MGANALPSETKTLLPSKNSAKISVAKSESKLDNIYLSGKKTINKITKKITHSTKKIDQKIPFAGEKSGVKWRTLNSADKNFKMVPLSDEVLFKSFKSLPAKNLDHQFLIDLPRSSYIINGKELARDNSSKAVKKLISLFPNSYQKLQLISSYATQSIFSESIIHLTASIPEFKFHGSSNAASRYVANMLKNGTVEFTATHSANLKKPAEIAGPAFKEFGLKISGILSPDKATSLSYNYYLK
ncbi:hypothetical protein HUT03_02905 [Candidatus Liberibacter africanus]|uniref:hypothetical protein n=1 Tax=Liberibacter africanus TaxID=34020 RepID=UPI0011DDA8E1|nr:hypothetical protein [Candidatus Liberibacter africanus]QTP63986.1 hypothetical protein HUT03_02905 [Candidatus Liberibacter africanus]